MGLRSEPWYVHKQPPPHNWTPEASQRREEAARWLARRHTVERLLALCGLIHMMYNDGKELGIRDRGYWDCITTAERTITLALVFYQLEREKAARPLRGFQEDDGRVLDQVDCHSPALGGSAPQQEGRELQLEEREPQPMDIQEQEHQ